MCTGVKGYKRCYIGVIWGLYKGSRGVIDGLWERKWKLLFGVWGLGFWESGLGVYGFRVPGGLRVSGSGFGVQSFTV